MEPSDSGIFRLASVGSYLDALSSITDEMSLKERSNLIFLDRCLHELWGLGQNVILNWCPEGDGIALLVVPHYAVAEYAQVTPPAGAAPLAGPVTASGVPPMERASPGAPASRFGPRLDFFQRLLSARRCLTSQ